MKKLTNIVYIGIGSNLGDRRKKLKTAIKKLDDQEEIEILKISSILETAPVDNINQPDFINQVIKISTSFSPEELMCVTKKTEIDMGRKNKNDKGPRLIDLDILLYNDLILKTENLIIPHLEIKNRSFIVEHLIELDSEIVDPETKQKYYHILYGSKSG